MAEGIKGFVVAGPASGVGKTTVTLARREESAG